MPKKEIEKIRNEVKSWIEKADFRFRMIFSRYYDDYNSDHPVMKSQYDDLFTCYQHAITCLTSIPKKEKTKEDYAQIAQYCHYAINAAQSSNIPDTSDLIKEIARVYAKEAAFKEKAPTESSKLNSRLSVNKAALFNSSNISVDKLNTISQEKVIYKKLG